MKLSDLVDFNPKRALKKGVYASFVEMASLPENGRDISNIDNKIFTGSGSKFSNGDTLFARITPCLENGKTSLVSGLLDNEVAFGSTEFIVLSAKEPEYDSNYIYYLSRLPEFRSFAQSRMEGTSGRQRVAWQALAEYEYEFPGKACRKYAGELLKKFDDKILLNHQINQTLEQMAQALFKSWFIDFEPIKAKIAVLEAGGSQEDATLAAMTAISRKDADALVVFEREDPEKYAELKDTAELFPSAIQDSEMGGIPKGWSIGKLGDIIEFNPKRILKKGNNASHLDMKNVPVTGHSAQDVIDREFSSGSKFINGDTLLARITPCLENGKTAFVDFLPTNEIVGWGSTEFIVMRSKKSLPLSLSYFFARLDSFRTIAIQSMQGTSGRQRADASVLEQHVWIVPPNEVLQKFGNFSDSILDGNRSRNLENKSLAKLRDALLPKLLSGEITLPEAKQAVSEAENV